MKWREEPGGPVIRGLLTGQLLARVNHTGNTYWRGTVWTKKGSSSCTSLTLLEAMAWCEGEIR
jgi:hypothetical protein